LAAAAVSSILISLSLSRNGPRVSLSLQLRFRHAAGEHPMRREMMRAPALSGLPAPRVPFYTPPVYMAPLYAPPIW
jgi:hypothetical protein